jgi:hypothetical protein
MNGTFARAFSLSAAAGLLVTGFVGSAAAAHPVKAKATTLTIHATKSKVTKNNHFKATVTGRLRSHKTPLADEPITLDQRKNGLKKWTPVPTSTPATTDSSGKVTFNFTQTTAKEQYKLVFAGDATYKHSHSGTITISRTK